VSWPPAVVWAILRALGKRIERLERTQVKVWWMDAERWLRAHRIAEVVVLCAQHLGDQAAQELKTHLKRGRCGTWDGERAEVPHKPSLPRRFYRSSTVMVANPSYRICGGHASELRYTGQGGPGAACASAACDLDADTFKREPVSLLKRGRGVLAVER